MLEAVHVRGMPAGLTPRERLHRLNACLSLSSEQQVCAAGALLAILAREGRLAAGPASSLNGGTAGGTAEAAMQLESVCEVSLDGYLLVDPASMAALQIFQPEAHPAAAMGIGECLLWL
jgi:DNA mismatch repair protein MSH5